MGHDHHFLERLDRVEREHLEYALGLYRDHEALRYVLSKIDVTAERVALAIGSVQRGPYVVVASNGHFVTCLAEGMTPGRLQVVPREKVDALRARYKDQRTREQIADDLRREGEGDLAFFTRIFDRAHAMCRDEFVALSAFAPLLAKQFYVAALSAATDFMSELGPIAKASKIRRADVPFARGLKRSNCFAAHAILVAAHDEGRALAAEVPALAKMGLTLTGGIALLGSMTHLLRSAWVAAQVGEPAIASYEAHLASTTIAQLAVGDIAALAAIACRHERLKPRIIPIFARTAAQPGHDEHETAAMHALIERIVGVVENPGADDVLLFGRAIYQVLTQDLPADDPHRLEAANVPDDLAKPALFGCAAGIDTTDALDWALLAIPAVAHAKAEEFYFEREVARRVCPEWTPQTTLEIVHRLARSGLTGGLTVVSERKPGRNEPCPCGSGKKYKKCHGA